MITKRIPRRFWRKFSKTKLFNYIPDKMAVKIKYRNHFLKKLDLKNPVTFNEKLQWLKLYNRRPEYTMMVDKYAVKKYIADLIGEQFIIPTLGVWDSFGEIDFENLPEKFVLKCTHDSESVKIITNKSMINQESLRRFFEKKLSRNFFYACREWPYKNVKPRIIAEKYLEDLAAEELIDYKFFCFNGEPCFLYVSVGLQNHSTAKISFYDLFGNELPFFRSDFNPYHNAKMPNDMNLMIETAREIASGINAPFVRVDLYEVNNRALFSEITFFPCGGYLPFKPEEWDEKIGGMIQLPRQ